LRGDPPEKKRSYGFYRYEGKGGRKPPWQWRGKRQCFTGKETDRCVEAERHSPPQKGGRGDFPTVRGIALPRLGNPSHNGRRRRALKKWGTSPGKKKGGGKERYNASGGKKDPAYSGRKWWKICNTQPWRKGISSPMKRGGGEELMPSQKGGDRRLTFGGPS